MLTPQTSSASKSNLSEETPARPSSVSIAVSLWASSAVLATAGIPFSHFMEISDLRLWVPIAVALFVLLPAAAISLALWRGYGAARGVCAVIGIFALSDLVRGVSYAIESASMAASIAAALNVAVGGSMLASLTLLYRPSARRWFGEHELIRRLGGPLNAGDQRCPSCGQRFNAIDYQPAASHWLCSRCKNDLPRPTAQ